MNLQLYKIMYTMVKSLKDKEMAKEAKYKHR
jgi:hypothetical protein